MEYIQLTRLEDVCLDDLVRKVGGGPDSDRIGCITSFIGVVRKKSGSGVVEKIRLGIDNKTKEKLGCIARDAGKKQGIINILLYHNLDELNAQDPIVYVLVSAEHRREAFDVIEEIVGRIKDEIHINLEEFMK